MQTLQIAIGLLVIVVTFLDFFHTTLSGNGFGFLSRWLNRTLNALILQNRNRFWFKYSGLIHLLMTASMWLCLLFFATFLIFTSGQEMVINGITQIPADGPERFYFTGYLLSTLGIGDFIPGNTTAVFLSGILAFSGFILISTGITYLLSVVTAVLKMKELAFFIVSIGEDIEEMYNFFKQQDELSSLMSDASQLRHQILSNASNYLSFPMVTYFLSRDRNSTLIVQLGRLYEVLSVIQQDWGKDSMQHAKIGTILFSIEKYLDLGLRDARSYPVNEEKIKTMRSFWLSKGYRLDISGKHDKRLSSSLRISGWDWEDIYKLCPKDEQ